MSIKKVQYIHTATLEAESKKTIHTGIYPTENTKFRIKGQGRGYINGNWICGFYPNSDSQDWRFFWFSSSQNLCMDWNEDRISLNGWGGDRIGSLLDFEVGNYYIKDLNTDTILAQGSHQGAPTAGYDIEVCVGSWWFEGIQIWDGDDLVFDGYAAVDDEGHIGIYDEISGELKYNSSLSMAYESFPDPYISTLTIDALYLGTQKCPRAYLGSELVYGKEPERGGWVFIDSSNFDRTLPITKCRFYMVNVPAGTPQFSATEGCFSELPNKNTDGVYCGTLPQDEWGKPKSHKFNMVYGGGKYTSGNEDEININTLPEVESGVYELTFPQTLYWSGVEAADTTPIYANGNLVEVYIESQDEIEFHNYLYINGEKLAGNNNFCGGFRTDYLPNLNTEIELTLKATKGIGDTWYSVIGMESIASISEATGSLILLRAPFIGSSTNERFNTFFGRRSGQDYRIHNPRELNHIVFNRDGLTINGDYEAYSCTDMEIQTNLGGPLTIACAGWNPNTSSYGITYPFRSTLGYYGDVIFRENGEEKRHYKPCVDANGVACFYDIITKQYLYLEHPLNGSFTTECVDDIQ